VGIKRKTAGLILLISLFLLGLLLLTLSDKDTEEDKTVYSSLPLTEEDTSDGNEYVLALEKQLKELISAIDGVSDVKIMITVENGGEYVYARETDQKSSSSSSSNEKSDGYVIIKDEYGNEAPILLKKRTPLPLGAAVVCKGGDNGAVKGKIIQLVSCVLGLPTNRIFVSE